MGPDLSVYSRIGNVTSPMEYAQQFNALRAQQDAAQMRQLQYQAYVKAQQDREADDRTFRSLADRDPSSITLRDLAQFSTDEARTRALAAISQASQFQANNAFRGAVRDAFQTPGAQAVSQFGPTPQAAAAMDSGAVRGGFNPDAFRANAYSRGADPMAVEQYIQSVRKEGPKVKEYQTMIQNGAPVTVALFEDGSSRAVKGFAPRPDVSYQDVGNGIAVIDKNTNTVIRTLPKSMTPDAAARLGFDQQKWNEEKNIPKWDLRDTPDGLIQIGTTPRGQTSVRPVVGAGGDIVGGTNQKTQQTGDVLNVIAEARKLIPQSTGSYYDRGVDYAARAVGYATPGDQAAASLKALEAKLMLSQPRMEGPQSDRDVQLYRDAAGQIGDPTVPPTIKMAALNTIEQFHRRYAQSANSRRENLGLPPIVPVPLGPTAAQPGGGKQNPKKVTLSNGVTVEQVK